MPSAMPTGSKRAIILRHAAMAVRLDCGVSGSSISNEVVVRGDGRGRGMTKNAAGSITPENIRETQKIHRQPKYAVRTPPRIRPTLAIRSDL